VSSRSVAPKLAPWSALPIGTRFLKAYRAGYTLVECTHDPGYRRLHDGTLGGRCRPCGGDARSTKGFTLPVKRIVWVTEPTPAKPAQVETLF
jgi:hypothetical protein